MTDTADLQVLSGPLLTIQESRKPNKYGRLADIIMGTNFTSWSVSMPKVDPDETQTVFRPTHKDRRTLPRIRLGHPGKVILPGGDVVNVMVHDLSRDGLQIRCGKKAAHAINPEAKAIKDGDAPLEIQVLFYVPLDTGKGRVKAKGKLMYFSLIAPDIVALGLKFKSISSGGVEHLRSVVKAALGSC